MTHTNSQPITMNPSVKGHRRSNNARQWSKSIENLGNLNRKGKLININHRAHQGSMRR